ncbi:DUF6233 domain-containing protein [Streptomyces stramineus]|uniref:Ada DNA repair metal-binding domain-containing protein n=1 Tax=Streptomyces stramineus TaxID=173861 RepID=A0ABN0ZPT6_9ACTN
MVFEAPSSKVTPIEGTDYSGVPRRLAPAPHSRRPQPEPARTTEGTELKWWRFISRPTSAGGVLHRGDCPASSGGALLPLNEARLILDEKGVRPCPQCHPESRLRQTPPPPGTA